MADVKGDISDIDVAGVASEKMRKRLESIGVKDFQPHANTAVFWDVFGESGHPVRATISDLGPLLPARLLNLNETQSGVLTLVFKIAYEKLYKNPKLSSTFLLWMMVELFEQLPEAGDVEKWCWGLISPQSGKSRTRLLKKVHLSSNFKIFSTAAGIRILVLSESMRLKSKSYPLSDTMWPAGSRL